jgi:hypothetical protein
MQVEFVAGWRLHNIVGVYEFFPEMQLSRDKKKKGGYKKPPLF